MNGRLMLRIFVCGVLLLTIPLMTQSNAAESGEFRGSWIANGNQALFPFEKGRQVYTFEISGHVNLQSSIGKKKDYWSECVGLADSATGIIGRCVWKDLAGPEIYLTLKSDQLHQGSQVIGTIVGGTGHLAGIIGDLSFNWSSVIVMKDADGTVAVTGETKNLVGRYRIP